MRGYYGYGPYYGYSPYSYGPYVGQSAPQKLNTLAWQMSPEMHRYLRACISHLEAAGVSPEAVAFQLLYYGSVKARDAGWNRRTIENTVAQIIPLPFDVP